MKKIIFAVFVTLMMSSAYADEEIQLAAVMVESGYSATNANKMIYAAPDNQTGGSSSYASGQSDYEYAVISGIVVGGMLAAIANSDSTSNH